MIILMTQRDLSLVDSQLRVRIIHSVNDIEYETNKALYEIDLNDCMIEEVREENDRTIIKYYIDDELHQYERM